MNNSGVAVKAQCSKAGIEPKDILVVYDDMAIDFGAIRLRAEGGAGGHNGIKSIIEHLGTNNFSRLRVGEHRQAAAVEHQPRHHVGELRRADGELATAARVRADRVVVHPPDLDAEFLSGVFAKLQRLRAGRRVVIDMRVEILDLAHV